MHRSALALTPLPDEESEESKALQASEVRRKHIRQLMAEVTQESNATRRALLELFPNGQLAHDNILLDVELINDITLAYIAMITAHKALEEYCDKNNDPNLSDLHDKINSQLTPKFNEQDQTIGVFLDLINAPTENPSVSDQYRRDYKRLLDFRNYHMSFSHLTEMLARLGYNSQQNQASISPADSIFSDSEEEEAKSPHASPPNTPTPADGNDGTLRKSAAAAAAERSGGLAPMPGKTTHSRIVSTVSSSQTPLNSPDNASNNITTFPTARFFGGLPRAGEWAAGSAVEPCVTEAQRSRARGPGLTPSSGGSDSD